jgi:hypothetical protein
MTRASRTFWILLAAALFVSRAAHVNILWADEDYHLAAAVQLLHGKMLYRDIWYDKPPLNALLFTIFGAWPGWPLRIASVALELGSAVVAFRFASRLWSPREGYLAASAVAFFHIFFFGHTAIPLEPDSIMVLPHLLAAYWAWSGRSALAGAMAGIAFLLNTKGLFLLAAALILNPAGWLAILGGFAAPVGFAAIWLVSMGAWNPYFDQVWRWGFLYASNSMPEPWTGPMGRLGSWLGFHGALVIPALFVRRPRLVIWLAISFAAACIGWRFPPRYLNQIFPPLVILAAGGFAVLWRYRVARVLVAAAVLIPVIRFGPRYGTLLAEDFRGVPHEWRDAALDRESREGASIVNRLAKPNDTIYIWGYRPNVVAYTRLPIAGQLWDSQPITLIPADRHFNFHASLDPAWAAEHQQELIRTAPTFIVDGLSMYNPDLDIHRFPALTEWFARYCEVGKAGRGMIIYRLCERYP